MPRKRIPSKIPTGVLARHAASCPASKGSDDCTCTPSWRAWVYDRRTNRKIQKSFATFAAAKAWREDARSLQRKGQLAAPSKRTLRDAADGWLAGAKADPPTNLNRSGRSYKPSALRGYEADLTTYVLPDLGATRLSDLRRGDLQALVDRLLGQRHSASKVRNVIVPVRVIFRHAIERDEVTTNPTTGLRLPNGIGRRERAASPSEAAELLASLPSEDRALWATAFYAGLRRGELRGLRWEDVDLAGGIINVRRAWDEVAGEIEPKSKGSRTVPIAAVLRDYLTELKASTGRSGRDFVFGATSDRPFTPSHIRRKAAKAWEAENKKRAKRKRATLDPIGLHECRHTYVSIMADAGVSLERMADYVGHSSTYMTDRYRHLIKGHEAEAARALDEYLARSDTLARVSQLEN